MIRLDVHDRFLARVGGKYNAGIKEYRLLEVAPSGNYVHLMDRDGLKVWWLITDVDIIEKLISMDKCVRKVRPQQQQAQEAY